MKYASSEIISVANNARSHLLHMNLLCIIKVKIPMLIKWSYR